MPMKPLDVLVRDESVTDVVADVLVVPISGDDAPGAGAAEALAASGMELGRVLRALGGEYASGNVFRVPVMSGLNARSIALVCVENEPDPLALRHAAAAAGRACPESECIATTLAQLGGETADAVTAVADGFAWGRYRFLDFKTDKSSRTRVRLHTVKLLSARNDLNLPSTLTSGSRLVAADWVRDMVNMPPREASPLEVAAEAARFAERVGVTSRIWSNEELAAAGFGAIVAVGSGSANEPCMAELRYQSGAGPQIALVGKGVTFDAGGLELKSSKSMATMKDDMAGAATVIGATCAAAESALDVNLVTFAPLVENMPSGTAMRPGDVVTHPDGTTTEIISPDSEGRLILADALAYAVRDDVDAIVDVATLTGDTALGAELWAILGNDDDLVGQLLRAGQRAGDPGWQLPLWRSYERYLRSDIADGRNSADWMTYKIGTVMGALFLARFVKDRKWAHIDNAATANRGTDINLEWSPLGATGSPIGPLISWLEQLAVA